MIASPLMVTPAAIAWSRASVTGRVDDPPRRRPPRLAQIGHRIVDRGADRRTSGKRPRRLEDQGRGAAAILLVADLGPWQHDLLVVLARPFDKAHADRPGLGRPDRLQDAGVGQRRGVTFALQLKFAVVDAPRNIGGKDNEKIDSGSVRAAGRRP